VEGFVDTRGLQMRRSFFHLHKVILLTFALRGLFALVPSEVFSSLPGSFHAVILRGLFALSESPFLSSLTMAMAVLPLLACCRRHGCCLTWLS
jgi:hypothetical protein